jgi:hypothetical protein
MTDRELLELAAKASGMPHPKWNEVHNYMMVGLGGDTKEWNPLEDDGDALRLAVKIGMRDYFGIEIQKGCTQATSFEPWEHCEYEEHNNDPYAATRRAIVRAAAEIGKSMEVAK